MSDQATVARLKQNGEPLVNGHRGKIKKLFSYDRDLNPEEPEPKQVLELTKVYRDLLTGIKEDPSRQGLLKTPERAAKAFLFFTKGYGQTLEGKALNLFLFNEEKANISTYFLLLVILFLLFLSFRFF